jgi:hypothetical protein
MTKHFTILVALVVLAALPAAAADVIYRGIDPWITVPDGTYADLRNNPIPAGFFCADSPAFDGYIWLRGVPLAADSDALGATDTIVERLDNAVFNKRGVAVTRVRVRALQLEGIDTFKTTCGDFTVKVTLDGEQPLSRMRILRESATGGRFLVPLAVNTKLIFTRVDGSEQLEFADHVRFPVNPHNRWSYRQLVPNAKRLGRVTVDTDWDGTPDTLLAGTSNFVGGWNGMNKTTITHGGHTTTTTQLQ